MDRVSIGFNGQMEAPEAARTLGCSYSHLLNLVRAKKIRAQKKEKRWFIESEDVYKAKNSQMVKPNPRKAREVKVETPKATPVPCDQIQVQLLLPREKFELLRIAFSGQETTLIDHLTGHLDRLCDQVKVKLKDLVFE